MTGIFSHYYYYHRVYLICIFLCLRTCESLTPSPQRHMLGSSGTGSCCWTSCCVSLRSKTSISLPPHSNLSPFQAETIHGVTGVRRRCNYLTIKSVGRNRILNNYTLIHSSDANIIVGLMQVGRR